MTPTSSYFLLLDLDALMDTRMGTLIDLDPSLPGKLNVAKYRDRERDDWTEITDGLVTTEAFDERYKNRDISILQNSIITGILPVLITYIENLEERYMRQVDVSSIRVDLNIWPYVLPGPLIETFRNCMSALVPPYVEVGVVSLPYARLTPEFMDKSYTGWVTYHFHQWLEVQHERLLVKTINGVAVILPKLHYKEPEELKDLDESLRDADKHGLLELVMEDFIHLEHIPVKDFCFIIPGTYRLPEDQSRSSSSAASDSSIDLTKSS